MNSLVSISSYARPLTFAGTTATAGRPTSLLKFVSPPAGQGNTPPTVKDEFVGVASSAVGGAISGAIVLTLFHGNVLAMTLASAAVHGACGALVGAAAGAIAAGAEGSMNPGKPFDKKLVIGGAVIGGGIGLVKGAIQGALLGVTASAFGGGALGGALAGGTLSAATSAVHAAIRHARS